MPNDLLTPNQQKTALQIARKTLVEHFAGRDYILTAEENETLSMPGGVFVTLRKNGNLRGCIGLFESDQPLAENVKEMTQAAAFEDNRFSSLTGDELKDITIEISVLSPMKKANGPDEIVLGTHGVALRQGRRSGIFLPQVAAETGWDKKTFLESLCVEKAGLAPNCYLDPNTEIYIFTAQVFEE